MRRKKRRISPLNLSFLDIMACGFGAVTLLFLILKHNAGEVEGAVPNVHAEVNQLQEDIRDGRDNLVELRNSLAQVEKKIVEAQGLSDRVVTRIEKTKRELSIQSDTKEEVAKLRKQVEELRKETAKLREEGRGENVRRFIGEGDRQYLTGLKLGGQRILILLDDSASMLDDTIVNVIRRRNMSDDVRRHSPKWERAVRTVEWLLAQLPPQSRYQLYVFNTSAHPAIDGSEGTWEDAADSATMDKVVTAVHKLIPGGGTSLINAFDVIHRFDQSPDNIFLITDGLPTQGRTKPRSNTVSGRERVKLFNEATDNLPRVPINIILFPMEGDPMAAALFWQLGIASRGAFLCPSKDWP